MHLPMFYILLLNPFEFLFILAKCLGDLGSPGLVFFSGSDNLSGLNRERDGAG